MCVYGSGGRIIKEMRKLKNQEKFKTAKMGMIAKTPFINNFKKNTLTLVYLRNNLYLLVFFLLGISLTNKKI